MRSRESPGGIDGAVVTLPDSVLIALADLEPYQGAALNRIGYENYGVLLGQACILALDNNTQAKGNVRRARRFIRQRPKLGRTSTSEVRVRLQDFYGDIVNFRQNPNAFERARMDYHTLALDMLKLARGRVVSATSKDVAGDWAGLANEITVPILLNRANHPDLIALQSLYHHDRGPTPDECYDVAVVSVGRIQPRPYGIDCRRVQVRSSRPVVTEAQTEGSDYHSLEPQGFQTSPEPIVTVYASELFGYGYDFDDEGTPTYRLPVVDSLIAECEGIVEKGDIARLERATNDLMQQIYTSETSSVG